MIGGKVEKKVFSGDLRNFSLFTTRGLKTLQPSPAADYSTCSELIAVNLIFNLHLLTCKLFQKLNFFMIPKQREKNLEHYFSIGVERGATRKLISSSERRNACARTHIGFSRLCRCEEYRKLLLVYVSIEKEKKVHIVAYCTKPSTGYDFNLGCFVVYGDSSF